MSIQMPPRPSSQRWLSHAAVVIDRVGAALLLFDDLLTYSRLSRAELPFGPELTAAGARVAVARPPPTVRAHRATLGHMLTSLIGNAVKFVAAGGAAQIVVSARREGPMVRVAAGDSGIGVAPEHQERIFRVFERLHGLAQCPSAGIGLAIVRKGVERMGGRVGVESVLGQGGQFWFTLPLSQAGDDGDAADRTRGRGRLERRVVDAAGDAQGQLDEPGGGG